MAADELVTVTTYRFAAKADVAKWYLEQEGIRAFVADATVVTFDWFLGNAVGYIKLQVPRSQAEAAILILQKNPRLLDAVDPNAADEEGPETCLACGTPMPDDAEKCPSCGWSYGAAESVEDA